MPALNEKCQGYTGFPCRHRQQQRCDFFGLTKTPHFQKDKQVARACLGFGYGVVKFVHSVIARCFLHTNTQHIGNYLWTSMRLSHRGNK